MKNPHIITISIRDALRDAANADKAPTMQSYMKSEMPYRGVNSPDQRKIYKDIFKRHPIPTSSEYQLVIRQLWDADFREERYAAIYLAKYYVAFQTLESLDLYRMMVETGAWWDYVDSIAADLIGNLLGKYPAEMKPIMKTWITDGQLWIRRTAILSQLKFKKGTDEEMLFDFCDRCLEERTFWIRKAVGWALREYSRSSPDSVRTFVEEHTQRMSGLTRREAIKYI